MRAAFVSKAALRERPRLRAGVFHSVLSTGSRLLPQVYQEQGGRAEYVLGR